MKSRLHSLPLWTAVLLSLAACASSSTVVGHPSDHGLFAAAAPSPRRRLLAPASLVWTSTVSATGVSSLSGTNTTLTCSCGFIWGLRVGVLSNGTATAISDVKLICPTVNGSEVLVPNTSDVAGLAYTNVTLNNYGGEVTIPLVLGTSAITQLYGVPSSGATGANSSLSCPSPSLGQVFIGLELELYTYGSGAQLIRITGECADATAPDVSCSNAATSCNAGQILVNGTCTDCLTGEYQSGNECVKCPAGTYQSLQAQAGLSSCLPCPAGKIAPSNGTEVCVLPPVGAKAVSATSYAWCPGGTIGRLNGTTCDVCPAGYYRGPGLASLADNVCHRVPGGYRVNWVGPSGGAMQVAACVAGTYSAWSDGNNAQANWQYGQTAVSTSLRTPSSPTLCQACEGNTVAGLAGATTCQACTSGTYPTTVAAPTPVTWSYTAVSGRDYSAVLQSSCSPCPAVTYLTPDNSSSFACLPCGPGQATGVSLGGFICQPCAAGSVNPGQVETISAGSPNASYYNPQPNQPSYYGVSASALLGVSTTCQPCPLGTYQDATGQTQCMWCPAGQGTGSVGAATCYPCPLGSYSSGPLENCQLAVAGYYVATSGGTTQAPCPSGTFSAASGAASCDPCPAGHYAYGSGNTVCTACSAGTYSTGKASLCRACPAGTYSKAGASTCIPCPPGHFNSRSGQSACLKAATGRFARGRGNKIARLCPKGSYANKVGQAACRKCPSGKYMPLKGGTGCLSCCSAGTSVAAGTCSYWTRGFAGAARCFPTRSTRRLLAAGGPE